MLFNKDLKKAMLVLPDGTTFIGNSVGSEGICTGELVFNTSMSGYQEIITDPSYANQIITFTAAHVGNTGCNNDDYESFGVHASGVVMRNCTKTPSNYRSSISLPAWFKKHNIIAIDGIDTRALTLYLRDKGAIGATITTDLSKKDEAVALAGKFSFDSDIVNKVSSPKVSSWSHGRGEFNGLDVHRNASQDKSSIPHIVVYDFGVKHSILKILYDANCKITIVPAQTSVNEVLKLKPHGVFFSNGPGDPKDCDFAIEAIKFFIKEKVPVFGICLGFQLLALALGAKSLKMKFGHHGANHPVVETGNNKKIFITSQNHGFAIDESSLPEELKVTHRSLFDHSLQGIEHKNLPAYGFQGHPEASPGPHDIEVIFNPFLNACRNRALSQF